MGNNIRKLSVIALTAFLLLCVGKSPSANARVILQTNEGIFSSDEVIIDGDDSSTTYVKLRFGNSIDAYLRYDVINDEFDINKNLNFNQTEAKNMVIHKGTVFPDAPVEGQVFYRTDYDLQYLYNGSSWQALSASGTTSANAETLDNLDSSQFLRSDTSDAYTSGTLTVSNGTKLSIAGGAEIDIDTSAVANIPETTANIFTMDADNSNGDITLRFGQTLAETLAWDNNQTRFELSDDLQIQGDVSITGVASVTGDSTISGDQTVAGDQAIGGGLTASGNVVLGTDNDNTLIVRAKLGDNLNFNNKQAKNLVIDSGTVYPSTPIAGQLFYRTDLANQYFYDGSSWRAVTTSGSTTASDADTLDNLDSTQFLRNDVSAVYSGTGTLTFNAGTTLNLNTANVNLAAVNNENLILDNDDTATTYITLQFGKTLNKYFRYDLIDNEFESNIPINLSGKELRNARIENLNTAPTCTGSVLGKKYFDTVNDVSYICTSTGWRQETNAGSGEKTLQLDINGGILTSMLTGTVAGANSPVLRADATGDSSSAWSFSVPKDWVAGTNLIVEMYWSPSTTAAGAVRWNFSYAGKASGEVVAAGNFTTINYDQTNPGTMLQITTTASQFTIPAAALAANDMVNIKINRQGAHANDTYGAEANIHMMKVKYTGS